MMLFRFPLSVFEYRRSVPTGALLVRSIFNQSKVRNFSSDFEPKRVVPETVSYEDIRKKLADLVENNKVVLFMKGSPTSPQCGFSRQVVQILADEGLTDYIYVDVLKSEAIRDSVKKFSDWPTIPQLYVDGKFVGGCDITKEMHKAGELKDLLSTARNE